MRRYSERLGTRSSGEVDAEINDVLIEIKMGVDSRRSLSDSLMRLASSLGDRPEFRGFLVLVDSPITLSRLQEEWALIAKVLRPRILKRLHLFVYDEDRISGIPKDPDADTKQILRELVSKERQTITPKGVPRKAEPFYDILRILINQWFRRAGPLTSLWLAEAAGCSYPTVASALKKLEKSLVRHSDRRVELKSFPKDEWFRLVANADKVRQTLHFADPSGQPRSVESLVSRLQKLKLDGVALAGVLGARRLHPSLDLIGTPRLDITLHCHTRQPEIRFLRKLDPALKPAGRGETARLAIHVLRYPHTFFELDEKGILWADPVECLLDLHEMRLEQQALEFLQFLTPRGGVA